MSAIQIVLVASGAVVFLALGSFVCVVIDRLPIRLEEENEYGETWETRPWREVLGGTSRCSDCGASVRWVHNVPVVSWLVLRGRCRDCGQPIPAFHPVVELASPLLFLAAVWAVGLEDWRLAVVLWLIPVGLAVSVIDLRTLIVPTRIVWPAFAVTVALSVLAAGLEGEWLWLRSAAIGLAVLAGPLFALWFVIPRGMGFGDVRLAVLLGWTVGFFAGVEIMAPVVLAVLCLTIASILGLVIGIVALGARGRSAQVPFGPALVLGAFLAAVSAPELLDPFGTYSLFAT